MSKHKRKAKRLQKCPQCGIGGFVNLKAHVCKVRAGHAGSKQLAKSVPLELVPPPESLAEIEQHLTPLTGRIQKRSEELLYDLVEAGLYLMKAQETHHVCHVAQTADGKFDGRAGDTGFQGWLAEKYPQISRRSAYRYIEYAAGCGLTIKDTSAAIDKMREAHALKGKTASMLLKNKDDEQEEEQTEKGGTRWSLLRDAAVNFREHSETVVELKPQMNKKVYSTVCARALRTLEELTGSSWDIVPQRNGERFKEHGDVYEIGS